MTQRVNVGLSAFTLWSHLCPVEAVPRLRRPLMFKRKKREITVRYEIKRPDGMTEEEFEAKIARAINRAGVQDAVRGRTEKRGGAA